MQNAFMATKPDKTGDPASPAKVERVQDFFLEPLPVPDAHESNGETVWGMWENSLEAQKEQDPAWVETAFESTVLIPIEEPVDRTKK